MVAIKNVLLFAISATASVLPVRDISAVQRDLSTVNSDVVALTDALNKYSGGVTAAVPVTNAADKLNDDLKTATTTTNNNAPASDTESQTIIDYVNNTLEPNVKTSINAAINKKSQFTAAGLKNTVRDKLISIRSNTNSLSTALVNKASTSKKSAAQAAANKVDADIKVGVDSFSS